MKNDAITYRPIGIVHTPYTEAKGTPIQPRFGRGVKGTVEIYPEYAEGLADLDGFSHIMLIYHLHRSSGYKLKVKPFLDDEERGLFATRAPRRPNPIGISTVRLLRVEGRTLYVEDLDILDGTPLLDVKPYTAAFEDDQDTRGGWLTDKLGPGDRPVADERFIKEKEGKS
jgi:tRNA-Thr(GGU) m(6)t(6)A37 methyltransferase TsaA